MKPAFGNALVYLDYKSEEPFISARLSEDKKLEEAYNTGDVYLHTAKLAGLAPANATDKSHSEIRNVFKIIVLATNYGMGVRSLTKSLSKYTIRLMHQKQQDYCGSTKKFTTCILIGLRKELTTQKCTDLFQHQWDGIDTLQKIVLLIRVL